MQSGGFLIVDLCLSGLCGQSPAQPAIGSDDENFEIIKREGEEIETDQ